MTRPIVDLKGRRFGKLRVLKRAADQINSSGKHRLTWLCRCGCGNTAIMRGDSLKGGAKSCGCQMKNNTWNLRHGFARVTQGPVYRAWVRIHTICNHPSNQLYPKYGGRGIRCEWDTFEEFYQDIGKEYPGSGYRLQRLDNNDDFRVDNVFWQVGTKIKGVSWHKKRRRYQVRIRKNGKLVHIGQFKSLEEAIHAKTRART